MKNLVQENFKQKSKLIDVLFKKLINIFIFAILESKEKNLQIRINA